MKPLSPPSSLLHHHHHHRLQTRCQGQLQSLQSWTSSSTKASIWLIKTRGGFSGNFITRPGFQHQETTTQGTRCKVILKLAPPMCLTYQDPTSVTWFPAAILVIQSMSTSPNWIEVTSNIVQLEADDKRNCPHEENSHSLQIWPEKFWQCFVTYKQTNYPASQSLPNYWFWWYLHKCSRLIPDLY